MSLDDWWQEAIYAMYHVLQMQIQIFIKH